MALFLSCLWWNWSPEKRVSSCWQDKWNL
jgi:hypothetical protein